MTITRTAVSAFAVLLALCTLHPGDAEARRSSSSFGIEDGFYVTGPVPKSLHGRYDGIAKAEAGFLCSDITFVGARLWQWNCRPHVESIEGDRMWREDDVKAAVAKAYTKKDMPRPKEVPPTSNQRRRPPASNPLLSPG